MAGLRDLRQVVLPELAVDVAERCPGTLAAADQRLRCRGGWHGAPLLALRLARRIARAPAAKEQRLFNLGLADG